MNRARFVFYVVLAVILSIVSVSAALNLLTSALLYQVYIACSIFSLGIVTLDFMGLLGQESEDGGADGDATLEIGDGDAAVGEIGADIDGGYDFSGEIDGGEIDGGEFDSADFDSEVDGGDGENAGHISAHSGSQLSDLDVHRGGSTVLSMLLWLRMLVYFSLGFGPTGVVANILGYGMLATLGMAIPMGAIALVLAQAFFRLQRTDTDSSLRSHDLLRAPAVVTVPLTHRTMGKVRVHIGMNVTEQYALAATPDASFNKGDGVQIVKVTPDCVYVL